MRELINRYIFKEIVKKYFNYLDDTDIYKYYLDFERREGFDLEQDIVSHIVTKTITQALKNIE